MKTAGGSLIAFIASRQPYWIADLFNFQFPNFGQQLLVTSFDQPIIDGLDTYANVGPMVQRSSYSLKNDLTITSLGIKLFATNDDYNGNNIKRAIHGGYFDSATLTMYRCIMPTPGDISLGPVGMFVGVVGDVSGGARGITAEFLGRHHTLNNYMPRNRYMAGCINSFGDTACTFDKTTVTYGGTINNMASPLDFEWVADPTGGQYDQLSLGSVVMLTGVAAGERRGLAGGNITGFNLNRPFYNTPQIGDTFNVTLGCDRTLGPKGCPFFFPVGQQPYRGFDLIPQVERAV